MVIVRLLCMVTPVWVVTLGCVRQWQSRMELRSILRSIPDTDLSDHLDTLMGFHSEAKKVKMGLISAGDDGQKVDRRELSKSRKDLVSARAAFMRLRFLMKRWNKPTSPQAAEYLSE